MKKYCYNTPIGKISIAETDGYITQVSFFEIKEGEFEETLLIQETHRQLEEYFAKKRKNFELPIKPQGTEFQQKVWKALQNIGYGTTATYGEIAKILGNPNACRAVGGANNKNKIAIIIPCHRVIGTGGSLTGYAGGIKVKEYLLNLEKSNS